MKPATENEHLTRAIEAAREPAHRYMHRENTDFFQRFHDALGEAEGALDETGEAHTEENARDYAEAMQELAALALAQLGLTVAEFPKAID